VARDVVMVNGLPGSGKSTLAARLANALGAMCLSKDRIKEALADAVVTEIPSLGAVAMETVWLLTAGAGGTVVIDSWWFRPRDREKARAGLAASGATGVVEVWCDLPAEVAHRRVRSRTRPLLHQDRDRLATEWRAWAADAEPLALGPVLRVDTQHPVDVTALATRVRGALWG
jgi:predicted kinase